MELDAATVDVLVVDDDAALRESIVEMLQQEGMVAIAAADGAGAVQLVRDRKPRVIVLDLDMPVMSGWQFLQRRRTDRELLAVPVIILSGLGAGAAGRYDVAAWLDKPLDPKELTDAIRPFLAPALPATRTTLIVVDDDEDTRVSVSELLEQEGYQVARAANGREAEACLRRGPRPACIVLDLWMPVMDGWSFTNRLLQMGVPPIPIVVITAAEPYWGYPVPLAQVVRKPIHPAAFVAMIKQLAPLTRDDRGPALAAGPAGRSR
jgi:CheY-like chemotaxis protein